jgi:hypothetical protein
MALVEDVRRMLEANLIDEADETSGSQRSDATPIVSTSNHWSESSGT